MKYAGVIGYPLEHSLSPAFQQAAFDHLKLDVRYEAWPTPPERLAETVESLRAPDRLGANVTIPHKEGVVPMMDGVDELARRVRPGGGARAGGGGGRRRPRRRRRAHRGRGGLRHRDQPDFPPRHSPDR